MLDMCKWHQEFKCNSQPQVNKQINKQTDTETAEQINGEGGNLKWTAGQCK